MAIQLSQEVRPSILHWANSNLLNNVPVWAEECLSIGDDEVVMFTERYGLNKLFSATRLRGIDTQPGDLAADFWGLMGEVPYRQSVTKMVNRLRRIITDNGRVSIPTQPRKRSEQTDVHPWVTAYKQRLKNKGRAKRTVLENGYIIDGFFRWLPTLKKFQDKSPADISLYSLTVDDVRSYIFYLRRAANTGAMAQTVASAKSCTVLSFLRFCVQHFMLNDVVQNQHKLPQGDTIDWWIPAKSMVQDFFETLLVYSANPARDFLMFALMYLQGLRPFESLQLLWSGVDLDRGTISFRAKGGHEVTMVASRALLDGLKILEATKANEGRVFVNAEGQGLELQNARLLFRAYAKISGWPDESSPRVFRHAFCTHLLQETKDYLLVNRLARHAKIETTQRYVHFLGQHYESAAAQIQDTFNFTVKEW